MLQSSVTSYPYDKIFEDPYQTVQTSSRATLLPLQVQYRVNGSGRDSYIGNTSGGQFKPYAPVGRAQGLNPEATSFHSLHRRVVHKPSPVQQGKFMHYKPDGSGRDIYIHHNSGGQASVPDLRHHSVQFKESLRKFADNPTNNISGGSPLRNCNELSRNGSLSSLTPRGSNSTLSLRKSSFNMDNLYEREQRVVKKQQSLTTRRLSVPKFRREQIIGEIQPKQHMFSYRK